MPARTIDARTHKVKGLTDLYAVVRGRASNAKVLLSPDQMEAVYWALAGREADQWVEPNCVPPDYRLGGITFEVVED